MLTLKKHKMTLQKPYKLMKRKIYVLFIEYNNTLSPRYDSSEECRDSYSFLFGGLK